jgi:hypothetical protein
MKRIVMETVAAVVLATMAAPSQASTNIAELQNISFAFTDLNLGDGVDPTLIDVPGEVLSGFGVVLDGYFPGGPGTVTDGFLTAPDLDIPLGEVPDAGGSGSMSPGRIVVEADATGLGTADLDGSAGGGYFVTPFTQVTLTADAVFQTIGGAGGEYLNICLDTCVDAQSFANGTQTRSFSLVYSNDTNQYVGILASVQVDAFASGVPELPASVLLLASGAFFAWRPVNRRLKRLGAAVGATDRPAGRPGLR